MDGAEAHNFLFVQTQPKGDNAVSSEHQAARIKNEEARRQKAKDSLA